MENCNLHKHEVVVILIATAIFPLLSLILGDALVALLLGNAGMLKMMFGERIIFAMTALFLWWELNKTGLIRIKTKQIFSFKQVSILIISVILITIYVFLFTEKYISAIYIFLFIVLNFLIAWEEEFVYRLLVPEILKILFRNFFIICLLQGIIFSYLGHMEESILDNLLYRLPLSIVLFVIRNKTGNILLSTTIHALWNIVLDFI